MHLRFFPRSARTLTGMDPPGTKPGGGSFPRNSTKVIVEYALGILSDPVCFRRFGLLWFLGNRRVIAINSLRQLSKQYVG